MNTIMCISSINWSNIWSFLTAASTLLLVWTAYIQIEGLKDTSKQDFLHKLKMDFFTKESRDLITIIENDWLSFELNIIRDDFSIFKIKTPNNIKEYLINSIDINRTYYTTQEVDDFLLGPLEDVGILLKNNTIELQDVTQQFHYYIVIVFNNVEIVKYINWVKEDNQDTYSNLEYLYKKIKDL